MKKQFQTIKLFIPVFLIITALSSFAQQQFTITSSGENNYCNGTCTLFDVPDLNSNPTAVIFITPVEVNGINLNLHPICAYYNGKQWSVMNIDNSNSEQRFCPAQRLQQPEGIFRSLGGSSTDRQKGKYSCTSLDQVVFEDTYQYDPISKHRHNIFRL